MKAYEEIPAIYDGKIDKDEEFELLEKFAGRFQRLVEIICGKYLPTYFKLYSPKVDTPDQHTFRDYLLFAEQVGIITNIHLRLDIRNERNRLTHDYLYSELEQLYDRAQKSYHEELVRAVEKIG